MHGLRNKDFILLHTVKQNMYNQSHEIMYNNNNKVFRKKKVTLQRKYSSNLRPRFKPLLLLRMSILFCFKVLEQWEYQKYIYGHKLKNNKINVNI